MSPNVNAEPFDAKSIGKKLRKLRKQYISPTTKRLTVEDVYIFLGMSRSTYYNIERGTEELSFEEAYRICCLYSVPLEELLKD
jgi:DNA-binding XRE family transcriptional regulator